MYDEKYLKELKAERNRFRRECRLTNELGRLKKAWRVGGTPEAGRDAMYGYQISDIKAAIAKATSQTTGAQAPRKGKGMEEEYINGHAPAGEREYGGRDGNIEWWFVSGDDGTEYVEYRTISGGVEEWGHCVRVW